MSYPAYDSYKDSGVEWLGDVPSGWEVKRLKFSINTNPSLSTFSINPEKPVSFVPMDAVGENGGISLDEEKMPSEIGSGYTPFSNNDVVVAKITPCFENGKGAIAENLKNGLAFGTTELHVLRAQNSTNPQFLFYLTMSHTFRKLGEGSMYGAGGQKRVSDLFIKDFIIGLPTFDEQNAIVAFLDEKTATIDALIAKKETLLDLLAEKRTALITQAVTKGLDPTAPMKPSGIDWLGDVPEGWIVTPMRYVADPIIGLTYSPDNIVEEGIGSLVLRASNIQDGKLDINGQKNIFVDAVVSDKLKVKQGDILVCSRNGSRRLIGKNALITDPEDNWTFGAFNTVLRGEQNEFLYWVLNSSLFEFQSARFLTSTINQLTTGTLKSIEVPVPPPGERNDIILYLKDEVSKMERLQNSVRDAILKLKEYRTALITNAVTGKIKVV